ncbi:hypothetical protein OJAV_G00062770 [Oryzias javanicus]|uniref:SUEL-type lectin domain-containing protein n=1 Tax=Oryzias javanicus TaxID=123683 RepID=A0A437D6I3_ORYJA|nr:hypothetical protein OJAV_G00062770 [Oryzias javanicus]
MQHFSATMLLAAVCLFMASGIFAETVITCENERVHTLECQSNEVISVQSSFYGRKNRNTCRQGKPRWVVSNTDCAQDMLDFIKERCESEQRCEVPMSEVRTVDPCWGTYKYIETEFTCITPMTDVTCENFMAKLRCGRGQVISVVSAYYGRRSSSVCTLNCPFVQTQNVDCENPTDIVAETCNGRRRCTIKASNSVFGDPCEDTYKYLEVSYVCVDPDDSQTHLSDGNR